jgi:hypothetical protein
MWCALQKIPKESSTFPWGKVDFDENADAFLSKDG